MEILWKEVSIIKNIIEKLKYQGYIVYSPVIMNVQCLNMTAS